MRVLSGIQPSGRLHLGNYFGAHAPAHRAAGSSDECFYFIANYHALTSVRDAGELRDYTLRRGARLPGAAASTPSRAMFFRQSDVPEVTELAWILSMRDADGPAGARALVQGQGRPGAARQPRPVRLSGAAGGRHPASTRRTLVPVGQDQKQHLEMTRDIAGKFNHALRRGARAARADRSCDEARSCPASTGAR